MHIPKGISIIPLGSLPSPQRGSPGDGDYYVTYISLIELENHVHSLYSHVH
jgi:hypothetical protein